MQVSLPKHLKFTQVPHKLNWHKHIKSMQASSQLPMAFHHILVPLMQVPNITPNKQFKTLYAMEKINQRI
jgi:hypothetical protein